jgi:hypothetical protein
MQRHAGSEDRSGHPLILRLGAQRANTTHMLQFLGAPKPKLPNITVSWSV